MANPTQCEHSQKDRKTGEQSFCGIKKIVSIATLEDGKKLNLCKKHSTMKRYSGLVMEEIVHKPKEPKPAKKKEEPVEEKDPFPVDEELVLDLDDDGETLEKHKEIVKSVIEGALEKPYTEEPKKTRATSQSKERVTNKPTSRPATNKPVTEEDPFPDTDDEFDDLGEDPTIAKKKQEARDFNKMVMLEGLKVLVEVAEEWKPTLKGLSTDIADNHYVNEGLYDYVDEFDDYLITQMELWMKIALGIGLSARIRHKINTGKIPAPTTDKVERVYSS